MFLGWGLFHRTRERNPRSRTKPFLNVNDGGQLHSVNRQKDENLPMQVHADLTDALIIVIKFYNLT